MGKTTPKLYSAIKQRGRERKGQKFLLRKWLIPYDYHCTILALFGRRILGQCPAAPSPPGPFVLLLIYVCPPNVNFSEKHGDIWQTRIFGLLPFTLPPRPALLFPSLLPPNPPPSLPFVSVAMPPDSQWWRMFLFVRELGRKRASEKMMENCQEKASAEIRGEFFQTNSWVNLAFFFVDLFLPFSLDKKRKIHPKIHSKIQTRTRELRGQNPQCKDLALKNWTGL